MATALLCLAGAGAGAVGNPEPSLADQAAAAAAEVNQAAQTVIPNVRVGFEVFDRVNSTVLASQAPTSRSPPCRWSSC